MLLLQFGDMPKHLALKNTELFARDVMPYLRDIWPNQEEIRAEIARSVQPKMFEEEYGNVFNGNPIWNEIPVAEGELYEWVPDSTYIRKPTFFDGLGHDVPVIQPIAGARVLAKLADSVTTDHISPAGPWLRYRGHLDHISGNTYIGASNTFTDERGMAISALTGEQAPLPEMARAYHAAEQGWVVVADTNYGEGSSREHAPWALLDFGIRCVIASSFADIFYNNCFKNGILPIVLPQDQVDLLMDDAERGANAMVTIDLEAQEITGPDGGVVPFEVEPFRKHCLINGLDDIGLTLAKADGIAAFERRSRTEQPWLAV